MTLPKPLAVVSRPAALLLAVTLTCLLGPAAISFAEGEPPASAAPPAYTSEEHWIVSQVCQFILDLGSVRKAASVPSQPVNVAPQGEEATAYQVQSGAVQGIITTSTGVWNPETYKGVAQQVFGKASDASPSETAQDCAGKLLNPVLEALLAENTRISSFLTEAPASTQGHVQAALLLGTIALNDHAGPFKDQRIPLNRMVAHLAIADALGAKPEEPGRKLAQAILLTLTGEQKQALDLLDDQSSPLPEHEVFDHWREILRLRNTLDWRTGREQALSGPPALQHEYFRSLAHGWTVRKGLDFLRESKATKDIAQLRIANEVPLSVSEGHTFTRPLPEVELNQCAIAAKAFGIPVGEDLSWVKAYLDVPEGSPVTVNDGGHPVVQVAGLNLFAGYHQRAYMQALKTSYDFVRDRWGVEEHASALKTIFKDELPELRYKPFGLRYIARAKEERVAANERCGEIIRQHPEWVTPELWSGCLRENEKGKPILPGHEAGDWFSPMIPRGTAFEAGLRMENLGHDGLRTEDLLALHARQPYSYALVLQIAAAESGGSLDDIKASALEKWLGPLAEFHLPAMRRLALAYQGEPLKYEPAMWKLAELDPDAYITLGWHYRKRENLEKAAEAFTLAFEKVEDRVKMSNNAEWLVWWLHEIGDKEQAHKVAADVAGVYSRKGLATQMWLFEQEGRWDDALKLADQIDERYTRNTTKERVEVLQRMMAIDPEGAKQRGAKDLVEMAFPEGLQKVSLADFSGPPTSGARFAATSATLAKFGLKQGEVVVAVDGYRVNSWQQYNTLRQRTSDPKMSLIVWDGSKYRLFEDNVPGRKFDVRVQDYWPD